MIYLAGCRCGQVIFGVNGKCSVASISNVRVMGRSLCTNCESASAAVSPIIVMQSVKRSEFSAFLYAAYSRSNVSCAEIG